MSKYKSFIKNWCIISIATCIFSYIMWGLMDFYNPQNEMLPFHKTKCSETQNEASSL